MGRAGLGEKGGEGLSGLWFSGCWMVTHWLESGEFIILDGRGALDFEEVEHEVEE